MASASGKKVRSAYATRDATGSLLRLWPYALLLIFLVALDQVTKWIARVVWINSPHSLGFVTLSFTSNTGSSFSMLQGMNNVLIGVSVLALLALAYFAKSVVSHPGQRWGYTLILAGIIGNLIDRALFGYVTDFIDLGWFPVFNVADSCLSVGVVGFLLCEFLMKNTTAKKASKN
jgi:signal peptidase II